MLDCKQVSIRAEDAVVGHTVIGAGRAHLSHTIASPTQIAISWNTWTRDLCECSTQPRHLVIRDGLVATSCVGFNRHDDDVFLLAELAR